MKICICSSFKFYQDVLNIAKSLANKHEVLIPIPNKYLDLSETETDKEKSNTILDEEITKEYWIHLLNHIKRIENSDVVYIYCKNGYIGIGVALEIGYSYSKGKKIYSSEKINDLALGCFINEIVPPEKLADFLTTIKT